MALVVSILQWRARPRVRSELLAHEIERAIAPGQCRFQVPPVRPAAGTAAGYRVAERKDARRRDVRGVVERPLNGGAEQLSAVVVPGLGGTGVQVHRHAARGGGGAVGELRSNVITEYRCAR